MGLTDVGGKDGAGATEQVRHETTLEEHRPLSLATQIFPGEFSPDPKEPVGFLSRAADTHARTWPP